MPRNGSGTFNRLYSWEQDAANNIKIRADRMDAEMDGMATALTNSIAVDGQTPITANLPMSGFKHTGVADATAGNEYAALNQLTRVAPITATDGGTDAYEFDAGGDVADGQVVTVTIPAANTTASPTGENTGGDPSGALDIVDKDGNAYIGMLGNRPHNLYYDGTNYVVLDPDGPVWRDYENDKGEPTFTAEMESPRPYPNVSAWGKSWFRVFGERDANDNHQLVTFQNNVPSVPDEEFPDDGTDFQVSTVYTVARTFQNRNTSDDTAAVGHTTVATIPEFVTNGHVQCYNSICRIGDGGDGKLVAQEIVMRNGGGDPGQDAIRDDNVKKGISLNGQTDENNPSTVALLVNGIGGGPLVGGWHNAYVVTNSALTSGGRAFWLEDSAVVFDDGRAAFGTDTMGSETFKIRQGGGSPVSCVFDGTPNSGQIVNLNLYGRNDGGSRTEYGRIQARASTNTAGSEQGWIAFQTMNGGTLTEQIGFRNGVSVGSPTGGFNGLGVLNAEEVQDDGTPLTDYVFDAWHGDTETATYSAPVQEAVNAFDPDWMEPETFAGYWKENRRLPGMPDLNDCIDGRVKMGHGKQIHKLTQIVELQAIHIDKLVKRIEALEGGDE